MFSFREEPLKSEDKETERHGCEGKESHTLTSRKGSVIKRVFERLEHI